MTFEEAVKLVSKWPSDRTVPRRLREAIEQARGRDRVFMEQLGEALIVASDTANDFELVSKYF